MSILSERLKKNEAVGVSVFVDLVVYGELEVGQPEEKRKKQIIPLEVVKLNQASINGVIRKASSIAKSLAKEQLRGLSEGLSAKEEEEKYLELVDGFRATEYEAQFFQALLKNVVGWKSKESFDKDLILSLKDNLSIREQADFVVAYVKATSEEQKEAEGQESFLEEGS